MDEELRAIRAQEAAADEVYAAHTAGDDSDWFTNALIDLAPKEGE